jgi:YcaO-like protein with predicted kinase domain
MLLFGEDQACPKAFVNGTHRACRPAETLRRFQPLMKRLGITRLANVSGLDICGEIPVYAAIRPLARGLSVAQGKGHDSDAAKVSALMESIEQWHAENIRNPLIAESYEVLRRERDCLEIERMARRFDVEPSPSARRLWLEGWDLVAEKPTWVPLEALELNLAAADIASPIMMLGNGLASGNTLLEATSHALCEVIERDATALWGVDASEPSDQLVDFSSAPPSAQRLYEALAKASLHLIAFDITSDIAVPTFASCLWGRGLTHRQLPPTWGFGTHLSAEVALSRAITEAVQVRLTYVSGARDDLTHSEPIAHETSDYDAFLHAKLAVDLRRRPSLATDTFEGDLEVLLRLARAAPDVRQVVAVNLSRPDLGVPVVQVVVPGLEGYPRVGAYTPGPRALRAAASRRST